MKAIRLLCLTLLLGALHQAAATPPVDEELRRELAAAMAEDGTFPDRFDAEVWLTDMSTRLQSKVPDEAQRLDLLKHVYYEAQRAKLRPELVLALIEVESNFDRFAISSAGAQGLMQVMPFWLKEIGRPNDNLFRLQTNLRMGCTILRYYMNMEQDNITRALARYNGSIGKDKYPQRIYQALRTRWFQ